MSNNLTKKLTGLPTAKIELIPGVDTISNLVGSPPMKISIPYEVMHTEELLRQAWNALHIAIIPYCYKCKTPLVWHSPPDKHTAFNCPSCKR